MITIIKNNDCSTVDISNSFTETFVGTLQLKVTDLVSKAVTTINIEVGDLTDGVYTYTTNSNGGIYEYKLVQTDGSTISVEKACVFLDCDIRCNVITANIDTILLHHALSLAESCDCDCENTEPVYELLLQELDQADSNCKDC